ncbi:MAG TPA: mannose-1-phosphate guanylyltransferase/mannose-6-phosphate isomerase [Burkholderiaceae bacterium]|jgi:mannose-1-phosphate guanylyltransferase|nr:mannose-1-phosphate guanylyltransferase/mannose-6-phosphate isomerase [Burkholderiaceae bacterium]
MKIVPVILCGGAGTRLWPVSRESMPKPFMRLADGRSLLQATASRVVGLDQVVQLAVVTNLAYSYKVVEDLAAANPPWPLTLLLEPEGRNTGPAVALAALWARREHGDDCVLLALPADHLIQKPDAFQRACRQAIELAATGRLVTFGITPTGPDPAFGYIEWGAPLPGQRGFAVSRFVEKPTREVAEQYLRAGNFAWNSGMFCFTVTALLDGLAEHAPEVLSAARATFDAAGTTRIGQTQVSFDAERFKAQPNISIDYALMERSSNVALIPCDIGWSDIGSWKAVSDVHAPDELGNAAVGPALFVDSRNTFVRAQDRFVATLGVDNLVVVDTPDALLVAHKDASQQVKQVVAHLKKAGSAMAIEHTTVHRPWGSYTVLIEGAGFKVKRIEVKAGASLSLQLHHRRSEHWVVISGTAHVTRGEETVDLGPNQSTYIPVGVKHRLANRAAAPLEIVEVQCGSYVGEDDIERFSDVYGRVKGEVQA